MIRLMWAQVTYRASRTVALLAGIVVATASFAVLTGNSRASQLQIVGTVQRTARAAYDILVRPRGSASQIEQQSGLVRPNYLQGIYGGISLAQWAAVRSIPGVAIAAPIAVVGYAMPLVSIPVDVTRLLGSRTRGIFRIAVTDVTDDGLSTVPEGSYVVYATKDRMSEPSLNTPTSQGAQDFAEERLPGGAQVMICADTGYDPFPHGSAINPAGPAYATCAGRHAGFGYDISGILELPSGHLGIEVQIPYPILIGAIDPAQEGRLDGLNRAIVSGRYLPEPRNAIPEPRIGGTTSGGQPKGSYPVLVSSVPYTDLSLTASIYDLGSPRPAQLSDATSLRRLAALRGGHQAGQVRLSARQAYRQFLSDLSRPHGANALYVSEYWNVGRIGYTLTGRDRVTPTTRTNPASVWQSELTNVTGNGPGIFTAPTEDADTAVRSLTEHLSRITALTSDFLVPVLEPAGTFDPRKLTGFSALAAVPLGAFQTPALPPADARSARLLKGRPLLPNANIAGYAQQPPLLLVNMWELPVFTNPVAFAGTHPGTPISAIRVRVAHVTGIDPLSRARVQAVANAIATRTGLQVDITLGSSPSPVTVDLPAGKFGRPALAVSEDWTRKGVAVAILSSLDRKSLTLFVMILIVCALALANAASAAVQARRTELGVLAAIGWSSRMLFLSILGEIGAVGATAGVIGAGLALAVGPLLAVHVGAARAALAIPAALLLALAAGAVPAARAARSGPAAAIRPLVAAARTGSAPRRLPALAAVNLLRAPGRSLLGAASLAIAVAMLTLLLAVIIVFRNMAVGSLLGDAVTIQARGADAVAVAATLAFGAFAIADVLYLGIRERAGEFAVLRALGWGEGALGRVVVYEGMGIGVAGAAAGAGAGLAAAAVFAGSLSAALVTVCLVAGAAGVVLAAVAAALPAALLRRIPTATLLADE